VGLESLDDYIDLGVGFVERASRIHNEMGALALFLVGHLARKDCVSFSPGRRSTRPR
jgi:hypothetical protein